VSLFSFCAFSDAFQAAKDGSLGAQDSSTDCVVLRSEHSVSDALVLICSFGFGCSYVSDFRRCSIENYLSSTQRRNGFESLNLSSYASCGSDVICVAVS
jgi:hypothetical protein